MIQFAIELTVAPDCEVGEVVSDVGRLLRGRSKPEQPMLKVVREEGR